MNQIKTIETTGCTGSLPFASLLEGRGDDESHLTQIPETLGSPQCFFSRFHLRRGKTWRLRLYFQWSH